MENSPFSGRSIFRDQFRRTFSTLVALILAVILVGCGGGGGSVAAGIDDNRPTNQTIVQILDVAGPGRVAAAAINPPVANGVTQSSRGNSNPMRTPSYQTADSVQASVTYESGSAFPAFTITVNGSSQNSEEFTVLATSTETINSKSYKAMEFYSSVDYDNDPETNNTWLVGELYTDLTENPGMDDTDYLVGGWWGVVPKEPAEGSLLQFGVFIDGNNKFNRNIQPIMGTATYSGNALGLFVNPRGAKKVYGTAKLTADFGGVGMGTIGGTIDGFKYATSGMDLSGSPTLHLRRTNIGSSSQHGFFTGVTSVEYASMGNDYPSYTGVWGGQFFGNGGTTYPTSVAGTFGSKTTDNSASIVGIFGAFLNLP